MWEEVLSFWFHSEVKFLKRWRFFLDLVIFAYFNATLIDFYAVKGFICIYLCNFYVFTREIADTKDLNAWRILMNFLCIFLGEGKGGGVH